MKSRQYSVRVLEVELEDKQKFIDFFEKNHLLFKNHLISINGDITEDIRDFMHSKSLKFIENRELPTSKAKKIIAKEDECTESLQSEMKVIDKIIRSGSEIVVDGDLLLLNRVNSGAIVRVKGNLIITKVAEGSIYCDGAFMMLVASPKAHIVFNGVEVDNSYLKDKLNRIELKDDDILITPVLKKEINWA